MSEQSYAPAPRRANPLHVVLAWTVTVLTAGYMLPWAIAATRAKSNSVAIGVLNLLLGWTVIGWVVALVMACSAEPAVVAVHHPAPPPVPPTAPPPPPPLYHTVEPTVPLHPADPTRPMPPDGPTEALTEREEGSPP